MSVVSLKKAYALPALSPGYGRAFGAKFCPVESRMPDLLRYFLNRLVSPWGLTLSHLRVSKISPTITTTTAFLYDLERNLCYQGPIISHSLLFSSNF